MADDKPAEMDAAVNADVAQPEVAQEKSPPDAAPAKKTDPSAGIKAWVRKELALAASGASREERENLNP